MSQANRPKLVEEGAAAFFEKSETAGQRFGRPDRSGETRADLRQQSKDPEADEPKPASRELGVHVPNVYGRNLEVA